MVFGELNITVPPLKSMAPELVNVAPDRLYVPPLKFSLPELSVNIPVLDPPPARDSIVPEPDTCTEPVLFIENSILIGEDPPLNPPVAFNVPELFIVGVAPPSLMKSIDPYRFRVA